MNIRLSWKSLFYNQMIPRLAQLDPEHADRRLEWMSGLVQNAWGPRRRVVHEAVQLASTTVGISDWKIADFRKQLGVNAGRLLARDFLLEQHGDGQLEEQFDVEGFEYLRHALARQDGVIIIGSHLGAYIPGLHWLYRQDLPLRAMIQRPRHVSTYLHNQLDHPAQLQPSSSLFLYRDLSNRDATERVLRARNVLREGMALYLCGDITTPGGQPISWFGAPTQLLDHWTYLAASTGAIVVPLFTRFEPGGRYRVHFETPFHVHSGNTRAALGHYLALLTQHVTNDPAQAVPYWTWPSYTNVARVASKPDSVIKLQFTSPRQPEPETASQQITCKSADWLASTTV